MSTPDATLSESLNKEPSALDHEKNDEVVPELASTRPAINYLQGLRLWVVAVAQALMLFITVLEVPVVSTALIPIVDELGEFYNVNWIVNGYLLGYVAVMVVFPKFSDIFGRKPVFLLSIMLFLIFSAACSAAQTMTQLIIFRALQGLGGGGSYSMGMVLVTEPVPRKDYPKYMSLLSIVTCLGLLLGPIIGGAIAAHTTWRWIFIINVPVAVVGLLCAAVSMPRDFPFQGRSGRPAVIKQLISRSTWGRVDILGTIIFIFAVLSFTAGFMGAGADFPWRSPYVITLLVLSGVFWITLLAWERYTTRKNGRREPILPWRFFTNQTIAAILLGCALVGGPFFVTILLLPQKFQLVNELSGLDAGVRLIPFTLASPVGTGLAAMVAGKFAIPPVWLILFGSLLQAAGFAILGTLPSTLSIPSRVYGAEILAGFAVAMGAAGQLRMMGGAVAVAIATSVFNGYTKPRLLSILGTSDTTYLLQLLATISPEDQDETRLALAAGYNQQMWVLCAFGAAQFPVALWLWRKKQIVL
ncbi:hypothetical protein GQX73_g2265 [Xylaria multiplex]|uniref:Major facilitator superfamily (MFS) profile domain-containing protein n=1 Tax=Xylaria multiplex TaxID=323545 RepID=A0A7C8MWP1_9PEZI|nr:hypothetical protein GQX73_g2265 [Xylaria multiplex]